MGTRVTAAGINLNRDYMTQHARVLDAPFVMRTSIRPSGREPDVLFVATERLDLITPTYLDGPADLVVEIVSPESVERDRGEMFAEYEAAGVREYWLIDPLHEEALFYRLHEDGRYRPGQLDEHGVSRSAVVPGFWIRVGWLWQRPLPDIIPTLLEIGGATNARALISAIQQALGPDALSAIVREVASDATSRASSLNEG